MLSCDLNWLQSDFYWQNRLFFPSEINSEPITLIMEKWTLDTNIVLCVSLFYICFASNRLEATRKRVSLSKVDMALKGELPLIPCV